MARRIQNSTYGPFAELWFFWLCENILILKGINGQQRRVVAVVGFDDHRSGGSGSEQRFPKERRRPSGFSYCLRIMLRPKRSSGFLFFPLSLRNQALLFTSIACFCFSCHEHLYLIANRSLSLIVFRPCAIPRKMCTRQTQGGQIASPRRLKKQLQSDSLLSANNIPVPICELLGVSLNLFICRY